MDILLINRSDENSRNVPQVYKELTLRKRVSVLHW